ncbi:hypothetical protein IQ268_09060 [Oculatella sp. LEGE 06141]|uniref:hypothetical protein n=1 Tax=Oculatella sp. LEGE 06141 TaxID=1828648 RepID=UPI00187E855B|nr:hypothetical protein [Oculatella sp. LEGE 06141]MBE9178708.1 hypothetical protein [Oculatella sp. LEGE 06141]
MTRLPWFVAGGSIAVAGFFGARSLHMNIPDAVDKSHPGKIVVEFAQPNPAQGKLLSLVAAGSTAGCLWMGMRGDSAQSSETALPVKTAPAIRQSFDEEDLAVPLERVTPARSARSQSIAKEQPTASVPEESVLFERLFNHRKRHLLVPAETGAGKTTFLLGAIEYFWHRTGGELEVYGSTVKPSPWLGLEDLKAGDGKPHVLKLTIDAPHQIIKLLERLRWLERKLVAAQQERDRAEQAGQVYVPKVRTLIVLDEWNKTLALAQKFDRLNSGNSDDEPRLRAEDELIALVETFLLMGREDEFAVWLFGQDHQVQNAKINTGYQKSFGIVVPGRLGSMQGMEQALTGRTAIVGQPRGREILQEAERVAEASPETTIIYSNLHGHEVLEVPHLPGIKQQRLFARQAPSNVVQGRFNPEPLSDVWA